jgi:hypothetical protein
VDILDSRERTPLIMSVQYGYSPLVRLLLFAGCDPCTEDDHGKNALYYALKRQSPEMVQDIMEALCQPQSLMRQCRSVIRRQLRAKVGYGHKLKPVVERIPKYELPRPLKRFLAYEPSSNMYKFKYW